MKRNKNNKKTRRVRFAWTALLWFGVLVLLVISGMFAMTQKVPADFNSHESSEKKDQVSEYLTHYLAPNLYNNIQIEKPFKVIVPQKGLNEIVAEEEVLGWKWPVEFNKVVISKPVVIFNPEKVRLIGKVSLAGIESIISVCAMPVIDEDGLLHLNIQYVRAGSLDISYIAGKATEKIIENQMQYVDEEFWLENLSGACRENKPFLPIFPTTYGKYIKLIKFWIEEKRLVLIFEPSSPMEIADKPINEKYSDYPIN